MGAAQDRLNHAIITLSAFAGLVMEGMTRGDGWRFLDIGRRLERALQMAELLRYSLAAEIRRTSGVLEAVLEIADSSITYRSRYLTSLQTDLVLDLLLVDEANPRSIAFQLARLKEHIDQLPASHTVDPPAGRSAAGAGAAYRRAACRCAGTGPDRGCRRGRGSRCAARPADQRSGPAFGNLYAGVFQPRRAIAAIGGTLGKPMKLQTTHTTRYLYSDVVSHVPLRGLI